MSRGIATIIALVIVTVICLLLYFDYTGLTDLKYAYQTLHRSLRSKGSIARIFRKRSDLQAPKKMSEVLAADGTFAAAPEAWVREYYARFAPMRADFLAIEGVDFSTLYNVLVPEAFCPNLVRVGFVIDGGKYVCNPRQAPEGCKIYSLGIHDEISFDRDIQVLNNFTCEIYGYDKENTSNYTQSEYKKINGKIEKVEFASETQPRFNQYTLADIVERNNHTSVEFLKIDIEEAEHQVLIPFLQKYKVCQIFVEIHGKAPAHVALLSSIANLDYALFSYEVNGNSMEACEYSFIHLNCMEKYGAYMMKRYLNELSTQKK